MNVILIDGKPYTVIQLSHNIAYNSEDILFTTTVATLVGPDRLVITRVIDGLAWAS